MSQPSGINKDKNAVDLVSTFSEFVLDRALVSSGLANDLFLGELAKEVPVIGTVVRLADLATGVRDRLFLEKMCRFAQPADSIPPEEREKFGKMLSEDLALQTRVKQNLPLLIDQLSEMEKATIVGWFFVALVLGRISYWQFVSLSNCVSRVTYSDICTLVESSVKNDDNLLDSATRESLAAGGLMRSMGRAMGEHVHNYYVPNEVAELLLELIKPHLAK